MRFALLTMLSLATANCYARYEEFMADEEGVIPVSGEVSGSILATLVTAFIAGSISFSYIKENAWHSLWTLPLSALALWISWTYWIPVVLMYALLCVVIFILFAASKRRDDDE